MKFWFIMLIFFASSVISSINYQYAPVVLLVGYLIGFWAGSYAQQKLSGGTK